jgi:hypothetical protein
MDDHHPVANNLPLWPSSNLISVQPSNTNAASSQLAINSPWSLTHYQLQAVHPASIQVPSEKLK